MRRGHPAVFFQGKWKKTWGTQLFFFWWFILHLWTSSLRRLNAPLLHLLPPPKTSSIDKEFTKIKVVPLFLRDRGRYQFTTFIPLLILITWPYRRRHSTAASGTAHIYTDRREGIDRYFSRQMRDACDRGGWELQEAHRQVETKPGYVLFWALL